MVVLLTPQYTSIMSQLRQISIDAPEDFSVQVAISLRRDVSEE